LKLAKYLEITTAGVLNEVSATVASTGAADDGKIVALDATGKLDNSVLPVGIGADIGTIAASENLAAGDFVNIWDSSGAKVRKADASGGVGKQAHGFILAGVTSGQNASVYFEGQNTQLTSLTPGATYYLSGTTAGAVTTTAPTTTAHIVQSVGNAIGATAINTEIAVPMIRA
jgi:hypothetical protein